MYEGTADGSGAGVSLQQRNVQCLAHWAKRENDEEDDCGIVC